jgi:hypothetical protein
MDETDPQIEEVERREVARRQAAQTARDLPGFGGAWIEDERLFVSVTWLPEHAEITLRPAAHSLAELAALMAVVEAECDRLGAR